MAYDANYKNLIFGGASSLPLLEITISDSNCLLLLSGDNIITELPLIDDPVLYDSMTANIPSLTSDALVSSSNTFGDVTVTYVDGLATTSDIAFRTYDIETPKIALNQASSFDPELICSKSGDTPTSNVMYMGDGGPLVSWASLDANGIMQFSASPSTASGEYKFLISSTYQGNTGNSFTKIVTVNVGGSSVSQQ